MGRWLGSRFPATNSLIHLMMQLHHEEHSSARPAEFTVRRKPLYSGSDPKELFKGNLNTKDCADLIQLLIGMN